MKEHAVSANAPFVDPISDEGFLQIFGNEANKVVVIDFLNTILEGLEVICDLQHLPVGSHSLNGEILLDLLCTDEKGEHFLVHLQRSEWLTTDGSLMYHGARLILTQPKEVKEDYLERVYQVGIMTHQLPPNEVERKSVV